MTVRLIILLLIDRPLCPNGILIVRWWYTSLLTEFKDTLGSDLIELHFLERWPLGVGK